MVLKAIPQKYKENTYRSRLEARWAIFFEHINVPVHYEYQGYDLGKGLWYLPDFYIPKWNCYFEVKNPGLIYQKNGSRELKKSLVKAERLRRDADSKTIISFGGLGYNKEECIVFFANGEISSRNFVANTHWGKGVLGETGESDCIFFPEWSEEDTEALAEKLTPNEKLFSGNAFLAARRSHIFILNYSIGFDFAMSKEGETKFFSPFSDPLLCSYNSFFVKSFKPFTKAYKAAREYRFDELH